MRKHTQVYLDEFYPHWTNEMYIPCEVCNSKAVDIHHIFSRGMGGSNLKDTPENLMALCRKCHNKYGDKKQYIEFLKKIHDNFQKKNTMWRQKGVL